MKRFFPYIYCLSVFFLIQATGFGQIRPNGGNGGKKGDVLDSLRKKDDERQDSIIYTARYIRYTTLGLLTDSTKTLPLDTTIGNFQNYSAVNQPYNPTLNLGSLGLPAREMLFNPSRTIGFDPGFHAFDLYLLTQDSVKYYRARAPYTELYFVNGAGKEQLFRATHSQNVTKNWNIGANYFRNGSEGFYRSQAANHLNAAVFTWYESKNKRYNLLANGLFNTIKAQENGGPVSDSIFVADEPLGTNAIPVKLGGTGGTQAQQTWKHKNFFLKQFYYIGRIDSLASDTTGSSVLPTQRVSHSISYSSNRYRFYSNQDDPYGVLNPRPQPRLDPVFSGDFPRNLVIDSTEVKNLSNELMYSFYLRGKAVKFIKNELKLDVGIQHDLYWYSQMGYRADFQNITAKARPGYRFSDRLDIEGDLQQIFQGRNAGDYFYEAHANLLLSRSVGRVVFGAYSQNKSPEQLFERLYYTFYKWQNSFDRTKVNNLNFAYENPKLQTFIRADYFLISNYLYLNESDVFPRVVIPEQIGSNINLLKVSLKKRFTFGKFNSEHYLVYQKTDYQDVLRTPEFYTYNSLYFANSFFKVLYANIGFDVRYNTPFAAPSYAVNINSFYNGPEVEFANYPVADVWIKASLKRANLFLKYGYANQGLFSKGYYMVNRYPMQDANLVFGVSWKFYD